MKMGTTGIDYFVFLMILLRQRWLDKEFDKEALQVVFGGPSNRRITVVFMRLSKVSGGCFAGRSAYLMAGGVLWFTP